MFFINRHAATAITIAAASGVAAFQPVSFVPSSKLALRSSSRLKATVDPTVVTKQDYADICGVSFDVHDMGRRLERTSYLYPRHVEVIEDFAHIANNAVDDIVSSILIFLCLMRNIRRELVHGYVRDIAVTSVLDLGAHNPTEQSLLILLIFFICYFPLSYLHSFLKLENTRGSHKTSCLTYPRKAGWKMLRNSEKCARRSLTTSW